MIKALSEIDFSKSTLVQFEGTVLEVLSEGDGEKKPIKMTLKLEESGETIQCSTWKFENLETLQRLVHTDEVYEFEGQAGTYGNFGQQIRIGNIKNSGRRSSKKVIKTIDSITLKREVKSIMDTYLTKSGILYKMVDILVMQTPKFWIWPAATKIHHAYPGGLAKHSLNVCKNAISIWKTYEGSNLNIEMLVAGSLLHDIGKLAEYKEDGSRTTYGNFIPHPVEGFRLISSTAASLNVDAERDLNLVVLSHIILSHHEKLEFGAPVMPYCAEAVIVARSDSLDAGYESMSSSLDNLDVGASTDRLFALDGMRIYKWNR